MNVRRQAPIGDDNYLHLAGASANIEHGQYQWHLAHGDGFAIVDSEGRTLPIRSAVDIDIGVNVGSSTESLKLTRQVDERSSGKSNKSSGSGYLTMSCLNYEPNEDSDASNEKPARPPKPTRMSTSISQSQSSSPSLAEYVHMEPKPPERRPKPTPSPNKCKEYELMANFASHAQSGRLEDVPPAVPPRSHHSTDSAKRLSTISRLDESASLPLHPKPPKSSADNAPSRNGLAIESKPTEVESSTAPETEPSSKFDTISNDDSLLDELQRDVYCVLKVSEDEASDCPTSEIKSQESLDRKDKEDYGIFSRLSIQRKSNPTKSQPNSYNKTLKTSNSTSNVHDVGSSFISRPLADRLTPSFLKKKPKQPEDAPSASKCTKKEDNLIGRLTPRFSQSRRFGRGQSLDLNVPPNEGKTKRIERSATAVSIPVRPINSSIVAKTTFFNLHRYGAQNSVHGKKFTQNTEEGSNCDSNVDREPSESDAKISKSSGNSDADSLSRLDESTQPRLLCDITC